MPTSNPNDILLAHDRWATRQLLDTCARLTPEQFHQRFEMGPGSLHATTAHILGAMFTWTQILAGQTPLPGERPDQDGQQRTPAQLIALHETITAAYLAEIGRLPLDAVATRVREGKTYTFTRGAILAHVATHGVHHRAQCMNMLRQLGVKPLPPSSVTEWTFMADGK